MKKVMLFFVVLFVSVQIGNAQNSNQKGDYGSLAIDSRNGKKLHLSKLNRVVAQGGTSHLNMNALKGQDCYLIIEMTEKKYKKEKIKAGLIMWATMLLTMKKG